MTATFGFVLLFASLALAQVEPSTSDTIPSNTTSHNVITITTKPNTTSAIPITSTKQTGTTATKATTVTTTNTTTATTTKAATVTTANTTTITPTNTTSNHTSATTTTSSTSIAPGTTSKADNTTTTAVPSKPEPTQKFSLASFMGGFVLCLGLGVIAFFSCKFYKSRRGTEERDYHNL